MRVVRSVRRSSAPLCSVCDGRLAQVPIMLCTDCVHPDRVRTYCAACECRLDLSLEDARTLFSVAGLQVPWTGIVLLFTSGCPTCGDTFSAPTVFSMEKPEPHDPVA